MSAGRLARLALSPVAAVALHAGCGGDSPAQKPEASGVGRAIGGSVAPLAQCRDWRQGSAAQRLATIEDIRKALSPQTAESEDTGFPDEEAYDLFERVCAQEYASAYRLYKVYGQAAAFAPLRQEAGN